VDFRILGPFEVDSAGGPLSIAGAKRRGLLALLVAHANETVSRDRIVDCLWEDARDAGEHTVQTYVSQLRKLLDPDATIATSPGRGYCLKVDRSFVDAARFLDDARLAEEEADIETRRTLLQGALAHWRGPALEDFAGMAWADAVAQGLNRRRLEVIEKRVEADLALGRAREVVAELEELVRIYPLAEPMWALRIVALYQCGRQADALRAFSEVRSILKDELGIEPSRALVELERRILDQDESLDGPAHARSSPTTGTIDPELPAGTVTFLLTDVVSSTQLWDAAPTDMASAVRTHERIIASVVANNGGHFLKHRGEGDSTLSVFPRAIDAVGAAIDLQETLAGERENFPVPVAVRVGLHTGEVEQRDRDYFGPAVNRAARIRGLAGPGEILCSRATADIVADALTDGIALTEIGSKQLRGLRRREVVYRVGRASDDPKASLTTVVPQDNDRESGGREVPSQLDTSARTAPVIGRRRERDLLKDCWVRSQQGDPQLVFLSGEPGIGKTRLAADIANAAAADGAVVLYGRADEGLSVPYQPFVEALRGYVEAHQDWELDETLGRYPGELVRLLPELSGRVADLAPPLHSDPATEQYRLFDAVASWLSAAALSTPVVLVLDDLQYAAEPTMFLLRHIVTSHPAGSWFVVVTYRKSEVGRGDPLVALLADLRSGAHSECIHHLELLGLDEIDVSTFIEAASGRTMHESEDALVSTLHRRTGGNPFFLSEILRHLVETGALSPDGDSPEEAPLRDTHIPDAARDVVLRRIARLSGNAQSVLTVAAVVGLEFDLGLVAAVSDVDPDALLATMDEAAAACIVEERGLERFSFAHALVQAALYGGLTESRRVRLHRRVGEAIEAIYAIPSRANLSELAFHYAYAVPDKAVQYAIAAADAALDATAFEDAAMVCERALACIDGARDTSAEVSATNECDLLLRLGRAEFEAGRRHARQTLLRAYELGCAVGDPVRAANALLTLSRGFFARMGGVDHELVSSLERAIDMQVQESSALVSRLLATLACELEWAEDGERRFELSDRALAIARDTNDPETLARVLSLRAITITAPDTLEERIANCNELLRLGGQIGDPAINFHALWSRSPTAVESGDFGALDELVESASRLAADLHQPTFLWQASFMRSARLILKGELEDAELVVAQTLELGQRANQNVEAFFFHSEHMLEIRRWQDQLAEVVEPFRLYAGQPGSDFGYSLTRYFYDAGGVDLAHTIYDEVMSAITLPLRRDLLASTTLCNLAYLAARFGDARGAAMLEESLRPYRLTYANTTVAKPVGNHFLGMLAVVQGDGPASDKFFSDALIAQDQAGAPLLAGETRVEWASALAERGETARASVLLDEAAATGRKFGAALLLRRCDEIAALL
jgi:DNA-binding SARP family transcriptional activator